VRNRLGKTIKYHVEKITRRRVHADANGGDVEGDADAEPAFDVRRHWTPKIYLPSKAFHACIDPADDGDDHTVDSEDGGGGGNDRPTVGSASLGERERQLKARFEAVDSDDSGQLSASEVRAVLLDTMKADGLTDAEMDAEVLSFLAAADTDQSGEISWEEFKHAIALRGSHSERFLHLRVCGYKRCWPPIPLGGKPGTRYALRLRPEEGSDQSPGNGAVIVVDTSVNESLGRVITIRTNVAVGNMTAATTDLRLHLETKGDVGDPPSESAREGSFLYLRLNPGDFFPVPLRFATGCGFMRSKQIGETEWSVEKPVAVPQNTRLQRKRCVLIATKALRCTATA